MEQHAPYESVFNEQGTYLNTIHNGISNYEQPHHAL